MADDRADRIERVLWTVWDSYKVLVLGTMWRNPHFVLAETARCCAALEALPAHDNTVTLDPAKVQGKRKRTREQPPRAVKKPRVK